MDQMTARTSEASAGPSVPLHRCHGGLHQDANNNTITCAEQLVHSFFPPFSSTLALLVLVAVLLGIILLSLATFHFHKRKLRNKKIQRAQEEYERDSERAAATAGETARPCVIVRPMRCAPEPETPLESCVMESETDGTTETPLESCVMESAPEGIAAATLEHEPETLDC
ncbi:uncharacterized protein C11orf87 homolog [Sebastes umbrosus]|uniref:uncharacterized protein C11orf87 homolog n=1 Tax=Sebastes umbrosus TaxID=72105 RepID=UPI0018A046BF|nr:uncharacterized protein C11orf87 homolog [Sebastes umbrosus]XP_037603574.1 uncharacterized protein C11orf87 homolog [Sebastes umbrosus]